MLALSFLVLIGASLIAEGFNFHIDKPFIYGPIAFAICVEALNLTYSRARPSGITSQNPNRYICETNMRNDDHLARFRGLPSGTESTGASFPHGQAG